jgi:hypothetical protein
MVRLLHALCGSSHASLFWLLSPFNAEYAFSLGLTLAKTI